MSMALHQPNPTATELRAAKARRQFREKIAAAAIRPKAAVVIEISEDASENCSIAVTAPQRSPYVPWFSIISEIITGPVTIAQIQTAVADYYDAPESVMTSARQDGNSVTLRWIGMYVAFQFFGKTQAAIGRAFGRRDHATARHGILNIRDLIKVDAKLAADIDAIRKGLLDRQDNGVPA
jgi:hypothetical protein